MGSRWHKATQQFLPAEDPRIVDQDTLSVLEKDLARNKTRQEFLRLCKVTLESQRQRQLEIAAWEERTGRDWVGPR